MPQIEWRHSRKRLLLPIVVMAPPNAPNPHLSLRIDGLPDTGATGTGIRIDVAETLGLRPKGQRRVMTASETVFASEYLMRIGFVCGDYTDPAFVADQQLPFVLEEPVLGSNCTGDSDMRC